MKIWWKQGEKMNLRFDHFISLDEFEKIQEENAEYKAEYNNGEILLSSNSSKNHNKIIRKIMQGIGGFFDNTKCEYYNEQIEVIFKNNNEVYKYKPDIFVICDDFEEEGESIVGVPKIIFEVVSENYEHYDYFIKLRTYEKFKVPEYNIVNQYGNIIQYILKDDKFTVNTSFHKDEIYKSAIFPDLTIDLKYVF